MSTKYKNVNKRGNKKEGKEKGRKEEGEEAGKGGGRKERNFQTRKFENNFGNKWYILLNGDLWDYYIYIFKFSFCVHDNSTETLIEENPYYVSVMKENPY